MSGIGLVLADKDSQDRQYLLCRDLGSNEGLVWQVRRLGRGSVTISLRHISLSPEVSTASQPACLPSKASHEAQPPGTTPVCFPA